MSFEGFTLSVSRAAASRKACDNGSSDKSIIYIKQDEIDPSQVVRLASFYEGVPSGSRPFIFLEPDARGSFDPNELPRLSQNIDLKPLGHLVGTPNFVSIPAVTSVQDFLHSFLNNAYSACIDAPEVFIDTDALRDHEPEELIRRLAAESLLIKAHDYLGNKFTALPAARRLLQKLDVARTRMATDDQLRYLLALRAILNLWVAYIDEDYGEGVDNSLAIAHSLGSEYLRAHCLRLAHLVSGYSATTEQATREAAAYFEAEEDQEAYVYSRNNYLLNQMHTTKVDANACTELAEFAINETPYVDRLCTIVNNAGSACIVAGDYARALLHYERAEKLSGQPIHHIGVAINKLTARYMSGERLDPDEILTIHRRLVRAGLPREFNYHQSYMHWTLARLSDRDPAVVRPIFDHLAERRFMNYDDVLDGTTSMVRFLARNMRSIRAHGRFPGPRGEFIHRTELVPIIHFSWM